MVSEATAQLTASLDGLEVSWTRTTTERFETDLDNAITDPAIGAPIPIEGVSLDGTVVTTNPTPAELDAAATGVTAADLAIASYGSVVVTDTETGTEPISLFPDRHVVVVHENTIVPGMAEAFDRLGPLLRNDTRGAVIATGPSATADMGALVNGVHGPREVHVLVIGTENERANAETDT